MFTQMSHLFLCLTVAFNEWTMIDFWKWKSIFKSRQSSRVDGDSVGSGFGDFLNVKVLKRVNRSRDAGSIFFVGGGAACGASSGPWPVEI